MVAVNQKRPYLFAQASAKEMLKKSSGVIINVSSEAGQEGLPDKGCYSATKGAVISFIAHGQRIRKTQYSRCCNSAWYH